MRNVLLTRLHTERALPHMLILSMLWGMCCDLLYSLAQWNVLVTRVNVGQAFWHMQVLSMPWGMCCDLLCPPTKRWEHACIVLSVPFGSCNIHAYMYVYIHTYIDLDHGTSTIVLCDVCYCPTSTEVLTSNSNTLDISTHLSPNK